MEAQKAVAPTKTAGPLPPLRVAYLLHFYRALVVTKAAFDFVSEVSDYELT